MKGKGYSAIIIALISAAYIMFRFWGMTASCLWFDEIFSVHAAGHSWDTLFSFVAQDLIHPPLFYVLLKLWIGIGGESLFWLRLFPVVFSILALLPFWMICKELRLKFLTVSLALGFFAVNGALIKYAQEVRMYSLLLFLSLVSMWLFTRFFYRGKNIWFLTLVNILLVYTHYFGWFVVFGEVAVILILQRMKVRHMLLMLAIDIAAFIPWVVAVLTAADASADIKQNIGWIQTPGVRSIFEFGFDVIEPFYFQQSNAEPSSNFLIAVPLLMLIAAAKIWYFIDWKSNENKSVIYILSIFSLVPVLAAFIASWVLPVSIWGSRHLIIVFAPMIILIAIFITSLKLKPVLISFVTLFILFSGAAFAVRWNTPEQQFIWCAWEDMAGDVRAAAANSDEPVNIFVFEDLVAYHFWFALRDSDKFKVNLVKGIDGLTEDKAYFLPRGFDAVPTIDASGMQGKKFWLAFRSTKLDPKEPPLRNVLLNGYKIGEPKTINAQGLSAFLILAEK